MKVYNTQTKKLRADDTAEDIARWIAGCWTHRQSTTKSNSISSSDGVCIRAAATWKREKIVMRRKCNKIIPVESVKDNLIDKNKKATVSGVDKHTQVSGLETCHTAFFQLHRRHCWMMSHLQTCHSSHRERRIRLVRCLENFIFSSWQRQWSWCCWKFGWKWRSHDLLRELSFFSFYLPSTNNFLQFT